MSDEELTTLEQVLRAPLYTAVYDPPLGPCFYCGEPSFMYTNISTAAASSVPSRMESTCRKHSAIPEPRILLDRSTVERLVAEVKRLRAVAK